LVQKNVRHPMVGSGLSIILFCPPIARTCMFRKAITIQVKKKIMHISLLIHQTLITCQGKEVNKNLPAGPKTKYIDFTITEGVQKQMQ